MKQEIATEASTQAATKAAEQTATKASTKAATRCPLHDPPVNGGPKRSMNQNGMYTGFDVPDCNNLGLECKEQNELQQQLLAEFYKIHEGEKRQDIAVSPFA